MKITILFHTSPRLAGGGTKILYEYANYLVHKGNSVEIAYMANQLWSNYHLPESLRRFLALKSIKRRPNWFELDKRIVKYGVFDVNNDTIHDADVIIITDVRTAYPVSKLNEGKGKKVYVIQDFENWVLPDEKVYETYSLDFKHITVAKFLSNMVDAHSTSKAVCVPNGINTDLFKVKVPIEKRKEHSIAFHYRSNPQKGSRYAFETIKILQEKYPDLDVTVVSIEEKPDDLPKDCKFIHGASPQEVADINNSVSVFMCTSVLEGFGLPGLEAMACGCALVTTDYTAVHEYAENQYNALISPVKDAESMARNVIRLFEDDTLRMKIARNAAITGAKRSLEISAKKFEEAIS